MLPRELAAQKNALHLPLFRFTSERFRSSLLYASASATAFGYVETCHRPCASTSSSTRHVNPAVSCAAASSPYSSVKRE